MVHLPVETFPWKIWVPHTSSSCWRKRCPVRSVRGCRGSPASPVYGHTCRPGNRTANHPPWPHRSKWWQPVWRGTWIRRLDSTERIQFLIVFKKIISYTGILGYVWGGGGGNNVTLLYIISSNFKKSVSKTLTKKCSKTLPIKMH